MRSLRLFLRPMDFGLVELELNKFLYDPEFNAIYLHFFFFFAHLIGQFCSSPAFRTFQNARVDLYGSRWQHLSRRTSSPAKWSAFLSLDFFIMPRTLVRRKYPVLSRSLVWTPIFSQ